MLHPEENEHDSAPMSRFTIKNEPDEAEQFGVKQEQGQGNINVINSPNHVPLAGNAIMMNKTSVKKELIIKIKNIDVTSINP